MRRLCIILRSHDAAALSLQGDGGVMLAHAPMHERQGLQRGCHGDMSLAQGRFSHLKQARYPSCNRGKGGAQC